MLIFLKWNKYILKIRLCTDVLLFAKPEIINVLNSKRKGFSNWVISLKCIVIFTSIVEVWRTFACATRVIFPTLKTEVELVRNSREEADDQFRAKYFQSLKNKTVRTRGKPF